MASIIGSHWPLTNKRAHDTIDIRPLKSEGAERDNDGQITHK